MSAPDANGWLDIKTAPKDGTPVRVFGPDPSHGKYDGPARWDGYRWHKLHRHGFLNMTAYPSHWRHLPKPPHGGSS